MRIGVNKKNIPLTVQSHGQPTCFSWTSHTRHNRVSLVDIDWQTSGVVGGWTMEARGMRCQTAYRHCNTFPWPGRTSADTAAEPASRASAAAYGVPDIRRRTGAILVSRHLLILPWFCPSCWVVGVTADLPSPHRSIRLLARSQRSTFQVSSARVVPSSTRSLPFHSQHFPQKVLCVPQKVLCVLYLSSSHARTSSISPCDLFETLRHSRCWHISVAHYSTAFHAISLVGLKWHHSG